MMFSAKQWTVLALVLVPLSALGADTLVVKDGAAFKPGVAKSWSADGTTVTFVLADGADGAKLAQLLNDRLSAVKSSGEGSTLRVVGLAMPALLEQLAGLALGGEDPLADLGGLGGAAVASNSPEGGGSIRASRPTDFAFPSDDSPSAAGSPEPAPKPHVFQEHDPHERFDADVMEVRRGAYPMVVLKLRVRRAAESGVWQKEMRKGRIIEATVLLPSGTATIDLNDPAMRRNLGAFYLASGDKVALHALAKPAEKGRTQYDTINVDWIERQ